MASNGAGSGRIVLLGSERRPPLDTAADPRGEDVRATDLRAPEPRAQTVAPAWQAPPTPPPAGPPLTVPPAQQRYAWETAAPSEPAPQAPARDAPVSPPPDEPVYANDPRADIAYPNDPRADARPPAAHRTHPHGEARAKRLAMEEHGWTTRRLTVAAAGGATATIAGGLIFVSKFGGSAEVGNPLMAVGFGLFVIGMIVFCAALIALIGTGISILAEQRGWALAAAIVLAPLALVWALWSLGAVGYALPAVLSLVMIGGLIVALK